MKNKFLVIVLTTYATLLTGQKVYDLGVADGVQQGYGAGVQRGFAEGRKEACMVKPI